jgi:hypothetical protein
VEPHGIASPITRDSDVVASFEPRASRLPSRPDEGAQELPGFDDDLGNLPWEDDEAFEILDGEFAPAYTPSAYAMDGENFQESGYGYSRSSANGVAGFAAAMGRVSRLAQSSLTKVKAGLANGTVSQVASGVAAGTKHLVGGAASGGMKAASALARMKPDIPLPPAVAKLSKNVFGHPRAFAIARLNQGTICGAARKRYPQIVNSSTANVAIGNVGVAVATGMSAVGAAVKSASGDANRSKGGSGTEKRYRGVVVLREELDTGVGCLHVATYDGYLLKFCVDLNTGGECRLIQETLLFDLECEDFWGE